MRGCCREEPRELRRCKENGRTKKETPNTHAALHGRDFMKDVNFNEETWFAFEHKIPFHLFVCDLNILSSNYDDFCQERQLGPQQQQLTFELDHDWMLTRENWDLNMSVNARAPFRFLSLAVPHLKKGSSASSG